MTKAKDVAARQRRLDAIAKNHGIEPMEDFFALAADAAQGGASSVSEAVKSLGNLFTSADQTKAETATPSERELVNHPQHYGGDTTYEVIKVLEAWKLGFHLGNTVKYIARAEHKGAKLDDLKKAQWYLTREIKRIEDAAAGPPHALETLGSQLLSVTTKIGGDFDPRDVAKLQLEKAFKDFPRVLRRQLHRNNKKAKKRA